MYKVLCQDPVCIKLLPTSNQEKKTINFVVHKINPTFNIPKCKLPCCVILYHLVMSRFFFFFLLHLKM